MKQNKNEEKEIPEKTESNLEWLDNLHEKSEVLADLVAVVLGIKDEYDDNTYFLANSIKAISSQIYKSLTEKLKFPSIYKCDKYNKTITHNIPDHYLNESCISSIIKNWKSQNKIKYNEKINCCLSVDALFFNPEIIISKNNVISGMKLSLEDVQKLPENASEIFSENPELFESFLRYNKNKINRTGFVFQIQPLNIKYPCFVCYIIPSTTGKANREIIEKLQLIKNIAKQHKIYIKSFAFDGDNCYNELHNQYYRSYINNLINKLDIKLIKRSKVMRVVSDLQYSSKSGKRHKIGKSTF